MKNLLLLLSLLFCIQANPFTGEFQIGKVRSSFNEEDYLKLRAQYQVRKDMTLIGGYEDSARLFTNQSQILKDHRYYGGFIYAFNKTSYIEFEHEVSKYSLFYAKGGTQITPHYIYKGYDLWLGVRHAQYDTSNIQQIKFGALKEINDVFFMGGQIFLVNSNPTATSLHLFSQVTWSQFKSRLDLASGKTVESDNLVGTFDSASLEVMYGLKGLSYGLTGTIYEGSVRDEKRYGLILRYIH